MIEAAAFWVVPVVMLALLVACVGLTLWACVLLAILLRSSEASVKRRAGAVLSSLLLSLLAPLPFVVLAMDSLSSDSDLALLGLGFAFVGAARLLPPLVVTLLASALLLRSASRSQSDYSREMLLVTAAAPMVGLSYVVTVMVSSAWPALRPVPALLATVVVLAYSSSIWRRGWPVASWRPVLLTNAAVVALVAYVYN